MAPRSNSCLDGRGITAGGDGRRPAQDDQGGFPLAEGSLGHSSKNHRTKPSEAHWRPRCPKKSS